MIQLFHANTPRPYWHVDLKWICGIAGFFAFGAALLLLTLTALTERERALSITTSFVASSFSREGLDDEAGVAEFRQAAALLPGDTIAPIAQFPWLTLSKQDIATLSPRELRLKIFRQITEPIYDKGLSAASQQFAANPEDQQTFQRQAAALGVLTKSTHDALRQASIVALIAAVVFLIGMILFSHGWGRLVSPAVIALLVSPLGFLFGLLLRYPPTNGDSPFSQLPGGIGPEIGGGMIGTYGTVLWAGIGLLVVAGVGKLVMSLRARSRKDQTPKA